LKPALKPATPVSKTDVAKVEAQADAVVGKKAKRKAEKPVVPLMSRKLSNGLQFEILSAGSGGMAHLGPKLRCGFKPVC